MQLLFYVKMLPLSQKKQRWSCFSRGYKSASRKAAEFYSKDLNIAIEFRQLGQASSRLDKQPLNCNLQSGGVSHRYQCQHCYHNLLTHFLRKLVFAMFCSWHSSQKHFFVINNRGHSCTLFVNQTSSRSVASLSRNLLRDESLRPQININIFSPYIKGPTLPSLRPHSPVLFMGPILFTDQPHSAMWLIFINFSFISLPYSYS